MANQDPLEYKTGQIVWFKLGFCWWPAEVFRCEDLPEDVRLSYRRPPILVVRLFGENKFEYVRSMDQISPYNCPRKNEFIKKGMTYRSNAKNKTKFRTDVCTAECRTNGNPNIIEDFISSPDIRPNYSFIQSPRNNNLSFNFGNIATTSTPIRSMSHILNGSMASTSRSVAWPKYDVIQDPSEDYQVLSNRYKCFICGLKVTSMSILEIHIKSHTSSSFIDYSLTEKCSTSSTRKRKATKVKSGIASFASNTAAASNEDLAVKRRRAAPRKRKMNTSHTEVAEKKDIRGDLIADWEEGAENDVEDSTVNSTLEMTQTFMTSSSFSNENETSDVKIPPFLLPSVTTPSCSNENETSDVKIPPFLITPMASSSCSNENETSDVKIPPFLMTSMTPSSCSNENETSDVKIPPLPISCFDFEEESDQVIGTSSNGRKIPRVIPQMKRTQLVVHDGSSDENTQTNTPVAERSEDPDIDALNILLAATTVPCVPDISDLPNMNQGRVDSFLCTEGSVARQVNDCEERNPLNTNNHPDAQRDSVSTLEVQKSEFSSDEATVTGRLKREHDLIATSNGAAVKIEDTESGMSDSSLIAESKHGQTFKLLTDIDKLTQSIKTLMYGFRNKREIKLPNVCDQVMPGIDIQVEPTAVENNVAELSSVGNSIIPDNDIHVRLSAVESNVNRSDMPSESTVNNGENKLESRAELSDLGNPIIPDNDVHLRLSAFESNVIDSDRPSESTVNNGDNRLQPRAELSGVRNQITPDNNIHVRLSAVDSNVIGNDMLSDIDDQITLYNNMRIRLSADESNVIDTDMPSGSTVINAKTILENQAELSSFSDQVSSDIDIHVKQSVVENYVIDSGMPPELVVVSAESKFGHETELSSAATMNIHEVQQVIQLSTFNDVGIQAKQSAVKNNIISSDMLSESIAINGENKRGHQMELSCIRDQSTPNIGIQEEPSAIQNNACSPDILLESTVINGHQNELHFENMNISLTSDSDCVTRHNAEENNLESKRSQLLIINTCEMNAPIKFIVEKTIDEQIELPRIDDQAICGTSSHVGKDVAVGDECRPQTELCSENMNNSLTLENDDSEESSNESIMVVQNIKESSSSYLTFASKNDEKKHSQENDMENVEKSANGVRSDVKENSNDNVIWTTQNDQASTSMITPHKSSEPTTATAFVTEIFDTSLDLKTECIQINTSEDSDREGSTKSEVSTASKGETPDPIIISDDDNNYNTIFSKDAAGNDTTSALEKLLNESSYIQSNDITNNEFQINNSNIQDSYDSTILLNWKTAAEKQHERTVLNTLNDMEENIVARQEQSNDETVSFSCARSEMHEHLAVQEPVCKLGPPDLFSQEDIVDRTASEDAVFKFIYHDNEKEKIEEASTLDSLQTFNADTNNVASVSHSESAQEDPLLQMEISSSQPEPSSVFTDAEKLKKSVTDSVVVVPIDAKPQITVFPRQDSYEEACDKKPLNPKKRFVRTFKHHEELKLSMPSGSRDTLNSLTVNANVFNAKDSTEIQTLQSNDTTFDEGSTDTLTKQSISESTIDFEPSNTALNLISTSTDSDNNAEKLVPHTNNDAGIFDLSCSLSKITNQKQFEDFGIQNTALLESSTVAELDNSIESYVQACINVSSKRPSEESDDLSGLSALADAALSSVPIREHISPVTSAPNNTENPNPTFLTDVLCDSQIEFTSIQSSSSKPVSFINFSVDFNDAKVLPSTPTKAKKDSSPKEEPDSIEQSLGKVFAEESNLESINIANGSIIHDASVESTNSSIKQLHNEVPEYSSSSKLLEILTDHKPKLETAVDVTTLRAGSALKPPSTFQSARPAILSKSKLAEIASRESALHMSKLRLFDYCKARKSRSKHGHRATKFLDKICSSKPPTLASTSMPAGIMLHKTTQKKVDPPQTMINSTTNTVLNRASTIAAVPRGKVNIIQQTIVNPGGNCQSSTTSTNRTTAEPAPVDETAEFDINAMPIEIKGIVIAENSQTLPTPGMEQSNITNVPTLSNLVRRPSDPLKLVSGKSRFSSDTTIVKTYSHKGKNATNLSKTSNTNCTLIGSRSNLPNKPIVVPTGRNQTNSEIVKKTLLTESSTSMLPATSTGCRLSSDTSSNSAVGKLVIVSSKSRNGHSRVQLHTHHGDARDGYNTFDNKKYILQQSTPIIKTTTTQEGSGKSCSLPSIGILPAVSGASTKPSTAILTSKDGILRTTPLQILPKINKGSLIATKLHGTGATFRSESILPIPRVSSKPRCSSTTTKAAFSSPARASPKTLNSLSLKGTIGSSLHIQNKFESPSSAKRVKLEKDNVAVSPRTVIIKSAGGEIIKKLGVEDALLEKQVQEQLQAIKASGNFIETKSKRVITKSKLPQKKLVDKKMSLVDKTTTKSVSLSDQSSPKLPKIKTSGLKVNLSEWGRTSQSTLPKSALSKSAPTKSAKQLTIKTESVSPPLKDLILCDMSGYHTIVKEGQVIAIQEGPSDSHYMFARAEQAGLMPLDDDTLRSIDPSLVSGVNNVMIDNSAALLTSATITESTSASQPPVTVSDVVLAESATPTICDLSNYDSPSNQQIVLNLTEGNQVLHNFIANADGNILLHVDDSHSLLFTEQAGEALLPCQPARNQDILAAALADTDVLQDPPIDDINLPPSPNEASYSTSVANALKSPIMATHELPSINSKLISDSESSILSTDVPTNVHLPITITDPNILQSVSQQHLLVASDFNTPLSVTEPGGVTLTTTQINNSSFVYLPSFDVNPSQHQTYSAPMSMPSLSEDCSSNEINKITEDCNPSTKYTEKSLVTDLSSMLSSSNPSDFGALSPASAEPPSEMFDSSMFGGYSIYPSVVGLESNIFGNSATSSDTTSIINSHAADTNEDSCEIPLQPTIVANLSSTYTANSPFLSIYPNDQPTDFSKRFHEAESSDDESHRKKNRYY